ncbi:Ribosomal_protein [Hexamita inflata]|uniref:Ribosomal protein n=1 Tax=Hexamita inflata TaxID=28002 RepID=A0AA86NEM9_9EUKA|nr:Ribosomal protein [Hexamita inflata]CAI9931656.1 Ribosomal protein [Hexamita inflata]
MQQLPEQIKEMKVVFNKIKSRGKIITGFKRCIQTMERMDKLPLFVLISTDCNELAFKRLILDASEKKGLFVSQRVPKIIMSQLLDVKENEAQVCVILDFGERWTPLDKKMFDKWFL